MYNTYKFTYICVDVYIYIYVCIYIQAQAVRASGEGVTSKDAVTFMGHLNDVQVLFSKTKHSHSQNSARHPICYIQRLESCLLGK